MIKAIIGFVVGTWALAALVAVGMVAMASVDVASADHNAEDYPNSIDCEYTLSWYGDTYDVRIAIDQTETAYRRHHVEVDGEGLRPDRLRPMGFTARFTEDDASTLHNFYVRGYTPATADSDVQVCERHGAFRVKHE